MWPILDDADAAPLLRQPVLVALRRGMSGWRRTEELAGEICMQLAEEDLDNEPRLRVHAAQRIAEALHRGETDAEFDADWAACLLQIALQHLRKKNPRAHNLMLRRFDRPEGRPPWTDEELAIKLARPVAEVEETLAKGREQLHDLFRDQVVATVADDTALESELALLEPHAARAF